MCLFFFSYFFVFGLVAIRENLRSFFFIVSAAVPHLASFVFSLILMVTFENHINLCCLLDSLYTLLYFLFFWYLVLIFYYYIISIFIYHLLKKLFDQKENDGSFMFYTLIRLDSIFRILHPDVLRS